MKGSMERHQVTKTLSHQDVKLFLYKKNAPLFNDAFSWRLEFLLTCRLLFND